jgi:hypothetical protein
MIRRSQSTEGEIKWCNGTAIDSAGSTEKTMPYGMDAVILSMIFDSRRKISYY